MEFSFATAVKLTDLNVVDEDVGGGLDFAFFLVRIGSNCASLEVKFARLTGIYTVFGAADDDEAETIATVIIHCPIHCRRDVHVGAGCR